MFIGHEIVASSLTKRKAVHAWPLGQSIPAWAGRSMKKFPTVDGGASAIAKVKDMRNSSCSGLRKIIPAASRLTQQVAKPVYCRGAALDDQDDTHHHE